MVSCFDFAEIVGSRVWRDLRRFELVLASLSFSLPKNQEDCFDAASALSYDNTMSALNAFGVAAAIPKIVAVFFTSLRTSRSVPSADGAVGADVRRKSRSDKAR